MKKITFFFLLLIVSFGYSQSVLEDLEGAAPTLVDDGTTSSVATNPDMTGTNTSANAIQIITNAASNPWQGSKLIMQNNKIDMTTTDKTMIVDVYSNAPREFLAKLSDGDVGGIDLAQESKAAAVHGGTGWETLTFDFNVPADTTQPGYNPPDDQFSSVIFFPLYDISNNGWCDGCGENNSLDTTNYIDNITAVAGDVVGVVTEACDDGILNNEETEIDCGGPNCAPCVTGSLVVVENFEAAAPGLVDDGTTSSVQANPDMVGPNTSANALQIITNAASNPWQGSKLIMQNNKIDMTTTNKTMEVDVYSMAPREFLAKLVDGDIGGADANQESKTAVAHTGSGWETLTFDFNVGADTTQPGYNPPNDQFSGVVFFPLYDISNNGWCDGCGENSSLDTTTYVDNVTAVAGDVIIPTLDILEDLEGAAPTLIDDGTTSSVQANPDMAGSNTSANTIQIITNAASNPWQGSKLIMQNNKIDMTTDNKIMTADVYSNAPREFLVKLVDGDVGGTDAAQESKTAVAHTGSGWETLIFDFNVGADTTQPGYNPPNDQFSGIVFFPLYDISNNGWCDGCGENSSLDTTTYVDNVSGVAGDAIVIGETCDDGILNNGETEIDCGGPNCDACLVLPTTAPPTPPARDPDAVISIYGEAYGPEIGLNNVPWDDPTNFEEENIASNNVLKVDFGTFMGSDLGSVVNGSEMTHFHMDYWVADGFVAGQVFNSKWSNHAGGAGETDAGELTIEFTGSGDVQNWVSIDVPLADFNNVAGGGIANRAELTQFLISVGGLSKRAYLDNIYLHKNTTLSTDEFDSGIFKVYPNPTSTSWTISGNTLITEVTVYDILGKRILTLSTNNNNVSVSTINMSAGMYFARIESVNGIQTVKLIKE